MSDWRDISTAPQDGTNILLYFPRLGSTMGVTFGWWNDDVDAWQDWSTDFPFDGPTHWMPLPEGPK